MNTEPQSKRQRQKERRAERLRAEAEQRKAQRRKGILTAVLLGTVGATAVGLLVVTTLGTDDADSPPDGVMDVPADSRDHVTTAVDYPTIPPAGGPHAPAWQNCGYYDEAVSNESAVHALEHGAVWLAFDPEAPEETREAMREHVQGQPFVLASPVDGLSAPVVASAWGKQLALDGEDDPRLQQFVQTYAQGPQTPEPGAPCTGGIGQPSA